jgi:hypothetical protein
VHSPMVVPRAWKNDSPAHSASANNGQKQSLDANVLGIAFNMQTTHHQNDAEQRQKWFNCSYEHSCFRKSCR